MSAYLGRFVLVILVALTACSGQKDGNGDTGSSETPEVRLPVTSVRVQVRLLDATPSLDPLFAEFGEENGVEIQVVLGPAPNPAEPGGDTLREIDASQLGDMANNGWLRRFLKPEVMAQVKPHFVPAARWRERVWGIPFRADLTFMVMDRTAASRALGESSTLDGWAQLTRTLRASAWGITDDTGGGLLDVYLPLLRGAGGAIFTAGDGITLTGPEAEDAISMFTDLGQRLRRGPASELAQTWQQGELDVMVTNLPGLATLRGSVPEIDAVLLPFPAADRDTGSASAQAWPRVLVLPLGGPHGDLGVKLTRLLTSASAVHALRDDGRWISCSSAPIEAEEGQTLELESVVDVVACLPAFEGAERALELLGHAASQALDRKRSPADALSDAQNALLTQPMHE